MGLALQVIGTFATNPGAAGAAAAAFAGDSLAVLNFDSSSSAELVNCWGSNAAGGRAEIHSPKLHDNIRGLEVWVPAGSSRQLMSAKFAQRLYAQDVLSVLIGGGAAETDALFLLNYYDGIGGLDARLTTPDAILPRVVDLVGVETVQAGGGPAVGNWSAGVTLNSTADLLKANTDYAVLGYTVDTEGGAVGISGPDTGNVRVGGPLTTDALVTRDWFIHLSERTGKACVPVINSANKGATLISTAQAVAGTAVHVVLHCAQLSA